MCNGFGVSQVAQGLGAMDDFLELEAFASRYGRTVANQNSVLKSQCIMLIVGENLRSSLDALAGYFVNDIPIHCHRRRFIHTTDFGDDPSEGHGWHPEQTSWNSSK